MKSLFEAILLIVCFTTLFLFYYILKKWFQKLNEKKYSLKRINIIKEEKRAQWYRTLKVALTKMEMNQITWVEIYIRGKDNERVNIECDPSIHLWKIKFRNMKLTSEIQSELGKYGKCISSYTESTIEIHSDDLEKLLDCIFYLLDRIIRTDDDVELILKY